ncbi:MAG: altronate dehydratase family protein [Anaerolineaceae bacterium]|nr:altronate dehydratase family protein [Anaerolineaceae bacterium]
MVDKNVRFFGDVFQSNVPFDEVAIRLNSSDNVAIARRPLQPGTTLESDGSVLTLRDFVADGHKFALEDLASGNAVLRYGQTIGFATRPIRAGDHVHTQNLAVRELAQEYEFAQDVESVDYLPPAQRLTFDGYLRENGQVGTRNFIAVISTVNCSAHTTREIAHHFTPERLADYPNVDGVIALAHLAGCAVQIGGADYVLLQRTLAGMARHANIGGYLIVGLGCEANQVADLVSNYNLNGSGRQAPGITIQGEGGIRKTIEAGVAAIEAMLPQVNACARSPRPVSELMVALQCGGSDGWSGVTANPVLGAASDLLVRQGGTVVLGETPEIYGAEQLLTRRAVNREVGERLLEFIRWWEGHSEKHGMEIDNNPSPGNKLGGLTTIYEKSLGAVAKGGSTPLTGVYEYAEPVTARGFTIMDSPGYDPVAVTGQVAGGSNLVVFTTGRGSAFGFLPAPSIKLASNSALYQHMEEDMDFDAGRILNGLSMEDAAQELLELMIAVASGRLSKSEAQGVGEAEFNPWNLGGTL